MTTVIFTDAVLYSFEYYPAYKRQQIVNNSVQTKTTIHLKCLSATNCNTVVSEFI